MSRKKSREPPSKRPGSEPHPLRTFFRAREPGRHAVIKTPRRRGAHGQEKEREREKMMREVNEGEHHAWKEKREKKKRKKGKKKKKEGDKEREMDRAGEWNHANCRVAAPPEAWRTVVIPNPAINTQETSDFLQERRLVKGELWYSVMWALFSCLIFQSHRAKRWENRAQVPL